ncbi:MAG: hypothetical protein IJG64_04330 [Oscillospiraceae bacterium]|nr:hypothetical protein [Oscillospiraceae bacterium]
MKKSTIAIVLCFIAAIAVLVGLNRKKSSENDEAVRSKQLEFEIDGSSQFYRYDESDDRFESFSTQMKRKNGDVFDKEYSGIELKYILDDLGISVGDETSMSAVCADNYEIVLKGSEILEEKNIYLITKESGEDLGEDSGPFMLVVNNDEFSTRWAKNVVKMRIDE